MEGISFQAICDSPLWNTSLTWDSEHPRFTPCFLDTVLCWTPSVFLLIFIPYAFLDYHRRPRGVIRWNWFNVLKISFAGLSMIAAIIELAIYIHYTLNEDVAFGMVTKAQSISSSVRILTYFMVALLVVEQCRHGYLNSGPLWFYLILRLLSLGFYIYFAIEFRPTILMQLAFFELVGLILLFLLVSFPESVPYKHKSTQEFSNNNTEKREAHLPKCPRETASFPSKLSFDWFSQLAFRGWKQNLTIADLWEIRESDKSVQLFNRFNSYWQNVNVDALEGREEERDRDGNKIQGLSTKNPPINTFVILFKMFILFYFFPAVLMLVSDLLQLANPTVLKFLILFMSDESEPNWHGGIYLAIFVGTNLIQTLSSTYYQHRMASLGARIRTCLTGAIYRKSMLLTAASKKAFTSGEIISLMSIDSQRILELVPWINYLWSAPLQIIITIYLLWQELGVAVFGGLAMLLALIPLNIVTANYVKAIQTKQMKAKDKRLKLVNEMLNGAKVLKLYAWEEAFLKNIEDIRQEELKYIRQSGLLSTIFLVPSSLSAFVVSCVTFTIYVLSSDSNILTPEKAFVSISLFNLLKIPMMMIPNLLSRLVLAYISMKRINLFLNSEEKEDYVQRKNDPVNAVDFREGCFSWNIEEENEKKLAAPPTLANIDLQIAKGSLVAVVGNVGSGKSSLLHAILGEMQKRSGSVNISGDLHMAYVAQQAWIQNTSVQKNILFNKKLETKRYEEIIDACALRPDFKLLAGGDQTEIGEKGINLSGGQKQRVSIARACYSDADLYLFDDPLSAVDSHVGKHIFDQVLSSEMGLLREHTRVLVTNALYMLPSVDKIVLLRKGAIEAVGTYQELLEKCTTFSELIQNYTSTQAQKEEDSEEAEDDFQLNEEVEVIHDQLVRTRTISQSSKKRNQSTGSLKKKVEIVKESGKLIQTEAVGEGQISLSVYHQFFKSISYSWVLLVLIFYIIANSFGYGSSFWLADWTENIKPDPKENHFKLLIYFLLGVGQFIFLSLGYMSVVLGTLRASRTLHKKLLVSVVHAPMSFFDTTPLGRIMNRFSKDIDVLDTFMVLILRVVVSTIVQAIATLVTVSLNTPTFTIVIVPFLVIYIFIQRFYIKTSRQLKRLESVTRSPIFTYFGETVNGVTTIKAFGACRQFIEEINSRIDMNQRCYYPNAVAGQWLVFRLEMLSNILIFFAAFSAIYAKLSHQNLTGSATGLSLSYALNISLILNATVRMLSEFENNVVAVERVKEYTELEPEDDWHKTIDEKIDKNWPQNGAIQFETYATRYRPGLDLVLRDLNVTILNGQKVGIVGRTGAGKSSITLGLFRIIEAIKGKILIDDIDISQLGLHQLRKHLTIIPQDPVLFVGTIRQNLDPLDKYEDEQLWKALELSHLKSFVASLEQGLSHPVSEGGDNLSIGQRQLICLARALLKQTKILVLDEATAAIDIETDSLIQTTIRSEFANSTVLTIAHRLNTILDSDRVMVLDAGYIAEYDSPTALLANPSSIFYSLAKDAGIVL